MTRKPSALNCRGLAVSAMLPTAPALTVLGDCLSGGRLYDKIGKDATAKVEYVLDGAVICKVKLTGTESLCERPHTDAEQMPQP